MGLPIYVALSTNKENKQKKLNTGLFDALCGNVRGPLLPLLPFDPAEKSVYM